MGDPVQDHDRLFKDLIHRFFRDFLKLAAPELAEKLPLAGMRFLEQEVFLDWPSGKKRQVDLLVRIPRRKSGAWLVHVEIEARFRPRIAGRLWAYFLLLRSRHNAPVATVLVCLRDGPPGPCRQTFDDTIGEQRRLFDFTVFSLSRCRAEEYLERPEPLAWGLAALMSHPAGQKADLKLACLRRIAEAKLSEVETSLLVNCVQTYLQLTPAQAARFEALSSREANQEVRAMMTWADRMMAKGRRENQRENATRNRQLLVRLLTQRFGEIPPPVRRRIGSIRSFERLAQLAEQVFVVKSFRELGLE